MSNKTVKVNSKQAQVTELKSDKTERDLNFLLSDTSLLSMGSPGGSAHLAGRIHQIIKQGLNMIESISGRSFGAEGRCQATRCAPMP